MCAVCNEGQRPRAAAGGPCDDIIDLAGDTDEEGDEPLGFWQRQQPCSRAPADTWAGGPSTTSLMPPPCPSSRTAAATVPEAPATRRKSVAQSVRDMLAGIEPLPTNQQQHFSSLPTIQPPPQQVSDPPVLPLLGALPSPAPHLSLYSTTVQQQDGRGLTELERQMQAVEARPKRKLADLLGALKGG